jgi:hypothetical protein
MSEFESFVQSYGYGALFLVVLLIGIAIRLLAVYREKRKAS